ncbi:hypothetical protein ACFCYX_38400, partial [Streptomyces populi]
MSRAEEFEELRPLLSAMAHRMPGDVHEAREVVREAGLRRDDSPAQPATARGSLVAAAARMSADIRAGGGGGGGRRDTPPPRPRARGGGPRGAAARVREGERV